MRVGLLTREYPPEVYGGAGVHVEHLAIQLRELAEVEVHCIGAPRAGATAHRPPPDLAAANPALGTLAVDVQMAAALGRCDVVHSHTWYANLAGHVAGLLQDAPHVVTAHSLEPARPWKAEQLGGGYRISCWAERTAYGSADAVIAVSSQMADDVLAAYPEVRPERMHVVHNGIDVDVYRPAPETDALAAHGIDMARPYVLFVGRITRQKGVAHLVDAARSFRPDAQVVLCAGAPDTPQIAAEMERKVRELAAERGGVIWIRDMLPRPEVIQLLSHAGVFVCPSVYEPQGIVNLEAMACEVPVVASRVGGIPEVVVDGETGLLVDYDEGRLAEFREGLARAVNVMLDDPAAARRMGRAGRQRAVERFSWAQTAEQTMAVYRAALQTHHGPAGQRT
jgi:starch synthase